MCILMVVLRVITINYSHRALIINFSLHFFCDGDFFFFFFFFFLGGGGYCTGNPPTWNIGGYISPHPPPPVSTHMVMGIL